MRSALSSQFWNEDVSSARSLDAVVHALPAQQAPPLGLVAGSRFSRSQQLLLLQRLLRIPCTPSYVVDADNNGGLVLDRVLANAGGESWWATLTGRVRAQRMFGKGNRQALLSDDKSVTTSETSPPPRASLDRFGKLKEGASRFLENSLESSLYSFCGRSRIQLGPRTALSCTAERDTLSRRQQQDVGGHLEEESRLPWRGSATLHHKWDRHQIFLEAAYHECFIDRESRYWEVPQTVSLDVASLGVAEGLRYRLGVHHSAGAPAQCLGDGNARSAPLGPRTGMRIQAGASLEKSTNLWKADSSRSLRKSYGFLEARPRISLSGALGGLLGARMDPVFGDSESQPVLDLEQGVNGLPPPSPQAANRRYSADLFASVGLNAQFGQFESRFFDFTKMGVRLDLGAVTALQSAITSEIKDSSPHGQPQDPNGHPTLAMSFQQQVIGPVRARIDSRVSIDPCNVKQQPFVQEIVYGLDCSLDSTGASKVCVWYSPTRREGMAEFRVLER